MEYSLYTEKGLYGVKKGQEWVVVPCVHKTKQGAIDELVYFLHDNILYNFLGVALTYDEVAQIKQNLTDQQVT